jgi:DNA-binding response OmpR family regulator
LAKVVIIEDDPMFAAALERVISTEHDVKTYPAVPENDSELFDSPPDIIFLDCLLPRESGPHYLERLRAEPRTSKVPVILMSGYEEMFNEAERLSGHYQEFLRKPCTMRQIMAVVQRYIPPRQTHARH